MKIFVDTAIIDEIKEAESWGILDGVTTNPSLVKKAVDGLKGVDLSDYICDILRAVEGPVSLEVIGTTYDDMVEEGKKLYDTYNSINDNVVVKIPVNTHIDEGDDKFQGIKAVKTLSDMGIPVNCTLVMTTNQALMAAKAGAAYVSPFVGRIDDHIRTQMGLTAGKDYSKKADHPEELVEIAREMKLRELIPGKYPDRVIYRDDNIMDVFQWGNDSGIYSGVDLIWSIKQVYVNYGFDTEIIAASIRTARQVRACAEVGADIATIPFSVIEDMMMHHKTSEGMRSFCADVVPEYRDILRS